MVLWLARELDLQRSFTTTRTGGVLMRRETLMMLPLPAATTSATALLDARTHACQHAMQEAYLPAFWP